ncbi:MAG: phage terminase large subunit [Desulfobaccales bacterium]
MLTLKQKFTKAEFRRRADSILGRLFREVAAFPDVGEAAKKARRAGTLADPFAFFTTYLPHYFSQEFAPFHQELVALLEQRPGEEFKVQGSKFKVKGQTENRKPKTENRVLTPVVVAAPREFAKTTITSFGYVLHQLCHVRRHFIILASDTEDLASDLTGYIYLELLHNERLKCDFGELVRDHWAVDDFVTLTDVRLKARGRGQRLRGLKHKQHRPDLIILDDLENDQQARSPDLVKKLLSWITGAVYPAIEASGSLFWIGTILARKSALYTAIHSEEEPWKHWSRRVYRALNEEVQSSKFKVQSSETGNRKPETENRLLSLWPARHPVPKLIEQKRLMGSLAFNREKQNNPVDEEGVFQEDWFRFYQSADLTGKDLLVAGFFDPSIGIGESSDYKALVTVGLERQEMIFYVLDAYIRRGSLDEALRAACARHEQWRYWLLGVEDNLFQKLLLREFDRLGRERGVILPVRGVTAKTAKETRISRLSALVERGQIRFCRGQGNQDLLLEQLLYFPAKTVHDDGPDALEGAIALLEGGAGMGIFDYYKGEFDAMKAEEQRLYG